jgi:hypothetical protein
MISEQLHQEAAIAPSSPPSRKRIVAL